MAVSHSSEQHVPELARVPRFLTPSPYRLPTLRIVVVEKHRAFTPHSYKMRVISVWMLHGIHESAGTWPAKPRDEIKPLAHLSGLGRQMGVGRI